MHRISCQTCPMQKCALFTPHSEEQKEFLEDFKSGELSVEPGTQILLEGSSAPQIYTVLEGMGLRDKTLENGRRQVLNFVLPGDFLGLQASVMGEMMHSIEAVTEMRLCVFRREDLWTLFRTQPALAYDVTWIAAAEEHFLGETVATLGQRDGTERVAWALLKLYQRLRGLGLEKAGQVPLPFRQQDLADALGLSLVHTNKTLSRLRSDDMADWSDGKLSVPDIQALAELAVTDPEALPRRPFL
ncbi:Crp/Fnr family transcriptional regulator [Salipiger abyssi]|uniref:cAMP-binding protein n=1 Tax=Salipiger abyssi TaxID=1250539 RepID=A0A1P8UUR2_9RHOB|nr:Crp/Fnr family transcriptional regulator [Salipiger abyssi]APZ53096.1 cAMP-binding protein [Salipiger abyssi]